MSELINTQSRRNIRWHLLTTVSALSLTVVASGNAYASDKPTVWIELGGQLERIDGREDPLAPGFTQISPTPTPYLPTSPQEAQKSAIYSYGAEGKISFRPDGSAWEFSAAIRYGRSNNKKHLHQQTKLYSQYLNTKYPRVPGQPKFKTKTAAKFSDIRAQNSESHAVIDFKAGRDVGLGIFSSTASLGVRLADFTSASHANVIARPEVAFKDYVFIGKYFPAAYHTDYIAEGENERSFHGVGPSLSWEGNIPVFGDRDSAITFDWGVNAAALFGRQKAEGTHQTSAHYYFDANSLAGGNTHIPPGYPIPPHPHDRSRSVVVPNIGGLAGISFRYSAAKVSFGYRADLFLGAMDMGIDTRHTVNRNFYGPFATIAVGL